MRGQKSKKKSTKLEKGDDQRVQYVHQSKISHHLYCPICSAIFTDPVFIECGHVYCRPCIEMWLTARNQCPECRSPAYKKNIRNCFVVRQLLGDMEVHCINSGCTYTCQLTNLEFHLKECKFNPKKLPQWLADNLKNWDGKDRESTSGIKKNMQYVLKLCQERIANGEIPDKQSIRVLGKNLFTKENIEHLQQETENQAKKRREEDHQFLASFATEGREQQEELKIKHSESQRSPLRSPINKDLRRSSTSPSSQPMRKFNNIFTQLMDFDEPNKKPKNNPQKVFQKVQINQPQENNDYKFALQLSKQLNGENAEEDFLTTLHPSKSNQSILRVMRNKN